MRFAIVGAGAIGSTYASYLAAAGHDVAIVDVWREHVEAVARDGLVAELPDGTSLRSHVHASTDASGIAPVDFVLVATKAFSTVDAGRTAAACAAPGAFVGTVQNGLGNDRALASVLGEEQVLPGATTVGAEMAGPGVVRVNQATAAGRSLTSLGKPRTATTMPDGVRTVCETLTAAGLPAEARDDVDYVIWRKLAMAASMAPVASVLRSTVQGVRETPAAYGLVEELLEEVIAVALAEGVALDPDEVRAHARETFGSVGRHPPSMTVDVLQGRRTEIDAFLGEVARRGAQHGVPTPVSDVLGRLVLALESGTL